MKCYHSKSGKSEREIKQSLEQIKPVTVFSEKTDVPLPWILFFYCCDLKKLGHDHNNLISALLCHNYISMKIWYESNHWFTRYCANKCDADANANADEIRTEKQYIPLPIGVGHNYMCVLGHMEFKIGMAGWEYC